MSRVFGGKPRLDVAVLGVVGFLLLVANAAASTFSPQQVYSVTPWPTGWPDAVAVGDFNGDGRKDVVLATTATQQGPNPDDYTLYIFLQTNTGSLAAPLKIKYSSLDEQGNSEIGWITTTSMLVADFNRDGIDDIVAGRRFGPSFVFGSRASNFSVKRVECTSGACGPEIMAVMDVDRDGFPDLLGQNNWGTKFGVTVYFSEGGSFKRQRLLTNRSEGGTLLRIGDMNTDGHDDLVVSWFQGPSIGAEVFLSDNQGWFLPGTYVPSHPNLISPHAQAIGDFNGDHRDDIALGGPTFNFDGRGFYLHKQQIDGSFQSPIELPSATPKDTANTPDKAITADMNGDGRDDLVVIHNGGDLGYFEQGAQGLNPEVLFEGLYATWTGVHGVAAGDINNDGCLDVVASNYNVGLVVFHGVGCLPPPIRVNGSQPLTRRGVAVSGSQVVPLASGPISASHTSDVSSPTRANTFTNPPSGSKVLSPISLFLWLAFGFTLISFVWWRWRQ